MKVNQGSWEVMHFLRTDLFTFEPIPRIFHEKIIIGLDGGWDGHWIIEQLPNLLAAYIEFL